MRGYSLYIFGIDFFFYNVAYLVFFIDKASILERNLRVFILNFVHNSLIRKNLKRVFIGEKEVNLTAKEFDLLELLITNPNKVYNRENLLNLVWGYDYPGDVRTVDVHVRRLREKVEVNPSEPRYIHTKWGVGYFFQN